MKAKGLAVRGHLVRAGALAAACIAVLVLPALARAATYYVAPTGSDAAAGTSQTTAWRTVSKVNGSALQPGDTVLFEGGQKFTDAALQPTRAGSAGVQIMFGSYGSGHAVITRGAFLTQNNLKLDKLSFLSRVRGTADGIVLDNDRISLAPGNQSKGLSATGTAWTVTGSTVTGAGGSGLYLSGSHFTVKNNIVLDAGQSAAATGARDGIVDKASDATISGNVVQDFWGDGISIDAHGSTLTSNVITNERGHPTASTTNGIVFRQDSSTADTSRWSANTIAGTTGSDLLIAPGSHTLTESFVLTRNSLLRFSGAFMTLSSTTGTCACSSGSNPEIGTSSGRTYYVARGGDDANAGTSPTAPWKTVAEVDSPGANHPGVALKPGDLVLFRGSQTFSDGVIDPASGVGGQPVVYGSWGPGKADLSPTTQPESVFFAGQHDVVVQDLMMDGSQSAEPDAGVWTSDSGTDCAHGLCSYDVLIHNCTIRNWREGVRTGPAEHDWTVQYTEIDHTTDNGIFFDRSGSGPYYGSVRMDALFNDISDTALAPPAHPHAIYDNSTSTRVIGNHIARFGDGTLPSSGISIRFAQSTVEDNTIDGGGIAEGNGIDFYDYDTGPECTTANPCHSLWAYNRIVNVVGNGIYVDYHYGTVDCGTTCPPQTFTIANNTVILEGADTGMIDFQYPKGGVVLANNIGTGSGAWDLGIEEDHATCPVGTDVSVSESHDDWSNSQPDVWRHCKSSFSTLSAYQSATGLGGGDLNASPGVSSSTFTLAPGSPAIDAGTTNVSGAPTYHPSCSAARFDYCGSAPDIGAVESGTP
jgi:hypothetical protein